uniref:Protoporphyrinogen oxidase n=1 Tax=Rhodosorus marinus TaxID=101924 RepID=A0A7S3ELQ9_9RHOD|mmetsp:Transcript_4645/g.19883  ORF Transcript_4645/g.19883 Transcript_4645/m.19883 type:complete len:269 (+) Transcript_4645:71-877(+)
MIGFTVSVGLDLKGPRGRVLNGRRSSTGGVVVSATAADGGNVKKADTLVVGSGVSGSSLAFALHKKGLNVLMTEARDRIGGNVITKQENGYTWEEGPNTFQPAPHIMRMAVDLGLKDDVVLADHTLPRFVFWNGKLFALPLGPSDIPKFRLLSPWGFIRAGLGAIGLVMPNTSGKEESVKEFVTRHLGKEVYERIIDPFVSGVYAGNPMSLSMSAAFKKIFALEQLGSTNGLIEGGIIRLQQRKKEAPPPDPELPTYKGTFLYISRFR